MSRRRSRRSVAIKPVTRMQSDINVTPLVDVVLVLLLIFMVVTPLAEKDMTVRIATTAVGITHEPTPPPSPQERLVVRLGAQGEVSINDEGVADQDYQRVLGGRLSGRNADDQVVFVVADDRARYARLVAIMDGAKKAGARVVGLTAEGPQH